MPRQCCVLCASDEGVFLDITSDNKHVFHEQFEICSLVEVLTEDQLPSKLCHKCVYELNQCSSFVQRFKHTTKQKKLNRKRCCSLCYRPARNELVFDLSKDQSLQHNSFDKIQKVFDYDLKSFKEDQKFICLSCRYTLDVLFDLKNLSKETAIKLNDIINEKVDYVNMPKIKTFVVSRKTTITESARTVLPKLQESSSDTTIITRTRSQDNKSGNNTKSNKKQERQFCGKCKKLMKIEDDMYKIHKISTSICKKCWEKSGHDKNEIENQIPQNVTEPKVCKVFLKDVLKNTEKLYTVNKGNQGNKTYVAKNKNVENESKSDSISNNTRNSVSKQSQKRSISDVKDNSKQTNNEPTLPKRSKVAAKQESDSILDSKESKPSPQETRQRKATTATQNVDSDSSVLIMRRSGRTLTKQKRATGASLSDADVDRKRNRMKLRNILEGNAVIKSFELTDESSSNEDAVPRKKRRFASISPVPIEKKRKKISKKDTSQQTPKNVFNKQLRYIKQSKTFQQSQSSESDVEQVVFDTTTYICDECGASYENKLMGLTHKLTHYKQPKIELIKVKNKEVAKEVSDTNEITDEQSKDQCEAAPIRVDDDEEEPAKDMNDLTENNTEDKSYYSKKEAMEDAVDMELVMKESDDDCTQTEKKTDESQKEEEITDTVLTNSLTPDEAEDKEQNRSSSDNNNDTIESVEKENIQSEKTHNTSVNNVEDKEEEKQNALPNDSEDVQEEKDQEENDKEEQNPEENDKEEQNPEEKDKEEENPEEKDKEEENPEENENEVNDKNEKKDENTNEQVTRTERKDSSEEEIISLGIWDESEGLTDKGSQKDSNNDTANGNIDRTKDDKCNSVEKKVEEDDVQEVEINKQKSSERIKKRTSSEGNKDQTVEVNTTIVIDRCKPIIVEDVLEKSIAIGDKDSDPDNVKVSKSDASKQEEQNECVHVAAEVLQEVIDLASAVVQKRHDVIEIDEEGNYNEAETVENISREIQNSV
nr:myb-like protein X [Osmia lignaria]